VRGNQPILATAIYETVPDGMRSRVLSATTASGVMIAPLGGLGAGLLVGSVGLVAALLTVGGAYLLITLGPVIFPAWREAWACRGTRRAPSAADKARLAGRA
jgi:hypothetical protein